MMITVYEFHAYYKQGDDFNHFLRLSKTVDEALYKWAESLETSATEMRQLADMFRDEEIKSNSDTHMVSFEGCEDILSEAVHLKLLQAVELPTEDEE